MRGYQPGWLSEMVSQACQDDIGAVGVKLASPKRKVVSNGIVLDNAHGGRHIFRGLSLQDPGYLNWAMLQKGYSALSSACMVIAKDKFEMVGGFSEQFIDHDYGDIDFCLKLRDKGFRNIVISSIVLNIDRILQTNLPSDRGALASRQVEEETLIDRWKDWFEHDSAFNPNLTLGLSGRVQVKLPPE